MPRPDPALPRPKMPTAQGLDRAWGIIMWTHRVEFAAEAVSVCRARRFVQARLREHGLKGSGDDVQLVVSELATNALTHARTPFIVTIQGDGFGVVLTVRDGSPVRPALVKVEAMAEGGRGISIVDTVSQNWGSVERPGATKLVWAPFALPPSS